MILAGDIGGTKTHLALFDWKDERTEPIRTESFPSKEYASLEEILEEFLIPRTPTTTPHEIEAPSAASGEQPVPPLPEPARIAAACFGVAGPVIQNHSSTTNLPWVLDGEALAKRFDIPVVRLLNDLEATAHGILLLRPEELHTLNTGIPPTHRQAIALIAAGTGLGESILFWDGTRYRPMPSEEATPISRPITTTKSNCCGTCEVTTST